MRKGEVKYFIKKNQNRDILEKSYLDAEQKLKYTTERLEEYNEFGPEFKTLAAAYRRLLDKIQATKDDIDRIKNY